LRFLKSRDCYSPPEDVYRTAKARGMDLVTLTDHDSIEGCLELLDRHPDGDVFVSEEVSCRLPSGDIEVHLGVYGTSEALHAAIQPIRGNVFEVCAALREAGVFFSLNHLLHFYRGQIALDEYLRLLDEVPALETRNGTMLREHNELVELIAERSAGSENPALQASPGDFVPRSPLTPSLAGTPLPRSAPAPLARSIEARDSKSVGRGLQAPPLSRRLSCVGGSDAHTLRRIGRTWTEAPGRNASDFLHSLAQGRSLVGGDHGGTLVVAGDAYTVVSAYVASLLGVGPRDHTLRERIACLAFAVVSLPAQFLPLAIAGAGKFRESREVRRAAMALADRLAASMTLARRGLGEGGSATPEEAEA
jgi:hypothetical protein